LLVERESHEVTIYDPVATEAAVQALDGIAHGAASVDELLARSDVVVIATPWPEFADLPLDSLDRDAERLVVIDCWGLLADERYERAVDIVRLGRGLEEESTHV
jgi:UDP-N-acetyl-D-mannosaminuronate dehydrogenase